MTVEGQVILDYCQVWPPGHQKTTNCQSGSIDFKRALGGASLFMFMSFVQQRFFVFYKTDFSSVIEPYVWCVGGLSDNVVSSLDKYSEKISVF